MKFNRRTIAPILIIIAASLWGADGVIRAVLLKSHSASSIVFWEHCIGAIVLLPFLLKNLKQIKNLSLKDWLVVSLMSLVSSVLGGYLFTLAFAKSAAYFDYITPNLLQKIQPVFVVILAAAFLKEKISKKFLLVLPLALIGSYLISFDFKLVALQFSGKEEIFLLSLGAAIAWGSGTIMSKSVLKKLDYKTATALRFALAIPFSFIFVLISGNGLSDLVTFSPFNFLMIFLIVFTTGAFSILIYYKGLKNTQAKVSSILELAYPIVAVLIGITVLNPFGAPQSLSIGNIAGILILIGSMLYLAHNNEKV